MRLLRIAPTLERLRDVLVFIGVAVLLTPALAASTGTLKRCTRTTERPAWSW